jgi:hypothetical protein
MNHDDYADNLIQKFTREITDRVFLYIEGDQELKRQYDALVAGKRPEPVNQVIGRKVKERFNLDDDGESTTPKSKLIQTFTLHKFKK